MKYRSSLQHFVLSIAAGFAYACNAPFVTIGNVEASNNFANNKAAANAEGTVNVTGNDVKGQVQVNTPTPTPVPSPSPIAALGPLSPHPTPTPSYNGGLVTTLAGSTSFGSNDGQGKQASFSTPSNLTVDHVGNIYVLDHAAIRKVTPDGTVTTLASNFGGRASVNNGGHLDKEFTALDSIVSDSKGNLFVTDSGLGYLYKITPEGQIGVFVGGGLQSLREGTGNEVTLDIPGGLCIDPDDNLYILARDGDDLLKVTPAAEVTRLINNYRYYNNDNVSGEQHGSVVQNRIARDTQGNFYICDSTQNTIHKIDKNLNISLFAGNLNPGVKDGPRDKATFNHPCSMVIDKYSVMYVADSGNGRIRRITSDGNVTTIAGGIPNKPNGAVTFADGQGATASFSYIVGLALDPDGDLVSVEQAFNAHDSAPGFRQIGGLIRTIK